MEKAVTIYEYSIANGVFKKYTHNACIETKRLEVMYFLRKKSSNGIWVKPEMFDKVSNNHIFTLQEDDEKNFSLLLETYEKRVEEHRLQLKREEKILAGLKESAMLDNKPVVNPLIEQIMEFEPSTLMIMGWLDNQGYKDVYSFDSGHKTLLLWDKEGLSRLTEEQLMKLLEDIQLF